MPYKVLPPLLDFGMVYPCVFRLYAFPVSSGISNIMSLYTLSTGRNIDLKKNCCLEFGSYVQTHESHDISMLRQTIFAIEKCTAERNQGGDYFFSIESGRRNNRSNWTNLLFPSYFMWRIHELAVLLIGILGFTWRIFWKLKSILV